MTITLWKENRMAEIINLTPDTIAILKEFDDNIDFDEEKNRYVYNADVEYVQPVKEMQTLVSQCLRSQ